MRVHVSTCCSRHGSATRQRPFQNVAPHVCVAYRASTQRVLLEVRASNAPARALYERLGFAVAGVRRRYYHDNGEDAVLMTLDLAESDASEPA